METLIKDQKTSDVKKSERKLLTGMFNDRESAERSYEILSKNKVHKRRHQFNYDG